MAADKDRRFPDKAMSPARLAGRPAKAPVTIDLAASAVAPVPLSAGTPAEPAEAALTTARTEAAPAEPAEPKPAESRTEPAPAEAWTEPGPAEVRTDPVPAEAAADLPSAESPDEPAAAEAPSVDAAVERTAEPAPAEPAAAAPVTEPQPPRPKATAGPVVEPFSASEPRMRSPIAPPPDEPAPGSRLSGLVFAGILGGLIALLLGAGVEMSGLLSSPTTEAVRAAAAKVEDLGGVLNGLAARVAALEAKPAPATDGALPELAGRVSAVEAAAAKTQKRLAELAAAPPVAGGPAPVSPKIDQLLDDLVARIDQLETAAAAGAGKGDVAPLVAELANRMATVEAAAGSLSKRLDGLAARPPAAVESEKATRALAIGTLRRAAAEGGAFAGDLAMLQALGSDDADVAALKPYAEKGAPTRAEVAATFPEVADRILSASTPVNPNAGFFDRLAGYARGLVSIRPTGPIEGDTAEAVVSRMQADVTRGDLAGALAEREALPADAKAASAAWAQAASDRAAIDRLVDRLWQSAGPATGGG